MSDAVIAVIEQHAVVARLLEAVCDADADARPAAWQRLGAALHAHLSVVEGVLHPAFPARPGAVTCSRRGVTGGAARGPRSRAPSNRRGRRAGALSSFAF